MNASTMIRPAWTPATVALTVAGFMIFWPLGLAMLAYVIFGDRFEGFKREANATVDGMFRSCRKSSSYSATGNVAFDEWREKEIERLNEERRKLDEAREEFDTYARELRRAKDQDEFDRFMANRSRSTPATTGKPQSKDAPKDQGTGLLDD